jgi:hypothetical protein
VTDEAARLVVDLEAVPQLPASCFGREEQLDGLRPQQPTRSQRSQEAEQVRAGDVLAAPATARLAGRYLPRILYFALPRPAAGVSETLSHLQVLLGERYTIERELGRGGTATVYLARESKHERDVAVKVLRADIGALLGAGRFLHEIKLTSRLHHPHILPLFDSGEADGVIYYVMPYVDGESLRGRLRREKQLPVPDALRFAREVADALAYAHAHNIVHRDIKPENILLADGHALVADFGIARAISRSGGEKWETVTSSGVVVGTPAYMSPEQATGERELDGRSDIYSLGCVLYEMLTGEAPFIGPDGELRLARRFTERVPSVRAVREELSEQMDAVIAKALECDRASRFRTAQELVDALSGAPIPTISAAMAKVRTRRRRTLWLASGGVTLAVALSVVWLAARRPSMEPTATPPPVAPVEVGARPGAVTAATAQPPPLTRVPTAEQQAGPATPRVAVVRRDSLVRAVRATGLKARRVAEEAGATASELAAGDASLTAAVASAREDRPSDAMLQLSSATAAWAEVEQAARARTAAAVQQRVQARAPTIAPPAATQPDAPQPSTPAIVDPRPAIESAIADYARAIGSRDVAEIRRVYPALTAAQARAWEQFFESVRSVTAALSLAQLDVTDDTAEASVVGTYDYVEKRGGRNERRPASFRATLRRDGSAWRLSTVR